MFYGVKNIFSFTLEGEANSLLIDKNYKEHYQAFEESVMLVVANSADEAFDIAEQKARESEETYTSIYGQTVLKRFIESVDCYLIDEDNIGSGLEIYSSIYGTEQEVNAKNYVKKNFKIDSSVKYMLLDRELFD